MDNRQYEKELLKKNISIFGGVDEVGRGPLFGPVVTACVVLPNDFELEGLTDSKKLSEKKRDLFYKYIIDNCLAYDIDYADNYEIDEYNIYQATKRSMERVIAKVNNKIKLEHVLIDAMPLDINIETTSIIKGDLKSITIAAASVIAKVTRDKLMYEMDEIYPMYGFKNHKGYPTKKHIEAINKHGLIEGYRLSFSPVSKLKK